MKNRRSYPFPKMRIGDSFFGDAKAADAAYHYAKNHGWTFVTRKEGDGIRIWRTW